jgi:hypothetical protein
MVGRLEAAAAVSSPGEAAGTTPDRSIRAGAATQAMTPNATRTRVAMTAIAR